MKQGGKLEFLGPSARWFILMGFWYRSCVVQSSIACISLGVPKSLSEALEVIGPRELVFRN